jgi:hypothetical protein
MCKHSIFAFSWFENLDANEEKKTTANERELGSLRTMGSMKK